MRQYTLPSLHSALRRALNRCNRNMAAVDRLYQAGLDFKAGRSWPTATQGIQHVWDIVRHTTLVSLHLVLLFFLGSHIYWPARADSCPTQRRESGRRCWIR